MHSDAIVGTLRAAHGAHHPNRADSLTLISSSFPGTIVKAAIWINVECNIGIVCGCLPLLRPVMIAIFPTTFRDLISRSKSGFSSRRKRSYHLSDEEHKLSSMNSGSGRANPLPEQMRGDQVLEAPKKGGKNWFSRRESWDDGDQEEMVPVKGITVKQDVTFSEEERV